MKEKDLLNAVWEDNDWQIMTVKKVDDMYIGECNNYNINLICPKEMLKSIENAGFKLVGWKTDNPRKWGGD